jgi:quercetin dioxygenase-like cupin family protein
LSLRTKTFLRGPKESRPTSVGKRAGGMFHGTTRIDPLSSSLVPAHVGGALVTFEQAGRTAWQAHPLRQSPVVMTGLGWFRGDGSPTQKIQPGDMVGSEPDQKQWRGSTKTMPMSYIAILEKLNGSPAGWL